MVTYVVVHNISSSEAEVVATLEVKDPHKFFGGLIKNPGWTRSEHYCCVITKEDWEQRW